MTPSFAELAEGRTHYELTGTSGAFFVLVHGALGPMTVWDKLVPVLVGAGHRTLRYDLLGRGQSERIPRPYTLELYRKQLEQLISFLKISEPIVLVGSSMGAIIIADFALNSPVAVDRFVFVGPAGFPLDSKTSAQIAKLPIVGDAAMALAGRKVLVEEAKKYFFDARKNHEFINGFETQLKIRGTTGAILSTIRRVHVQDSLELYQTLGRKQKPTILVWGKQDRTFPYYHHPEFLKAVPKARLIEVDRAAHLPQYERADFVGTAMLDFLSWH